MRTFEELINNKDHGRKYLLPDIGSLQKHKHAYLFDYLSPICFLDIHPILNNIRNIFAESNIKYLMLASKEKAVLDI